MFHLSSARFDHENCKIRFFLVYSVGTCATGEKEKNKKGNTFSSCLSQTVKHTHVHAYTNTCCLLENFGIYYMSLYGKLCFCIKIKGLRRKIRYFLFKSQKTIRKQCSLPSSGKNKIK